MKSKFLPILLVILLLAAVMAGCSSAAEEPAADDEVYIAVISKGFQHQFWQAVESGTEKAAEEFGVTVTFEGPETEAMVDKQVEMVQAALDKDPAALCLAALDTQALIPMLERAQEEGIPVVGFDSGVDSDIPVATAATDNLAAAALAADKMAEFIGDNPTHKIIPGISRVSHADRIAKKINFSKEDRHQYMKENGYL